MTNDTKSRCPWPGADELMLRYHDEEWGAPTHDDRTLFEFLALEAAQAGLSWRTILHKRAAFVRAFDGFHPERVALLGDADIERMLQDAGIVRNRLKLRAIVHNAQRFVEVQREFGSFDAYLWGFFDEAPLPRPVVLTGEMVPATTPESDALSADLKRRGLKFVGSTIVYAYMQSVGLVNDHVTGCFRAPSG